MDDRYIIKKVDTIDSTNDELEKYAYSNDGDNKQDILLVAREQTKGKGRYDRKFYSPKGSGLYMSLLHYYDDILDIEDITLKVGFTISCVLKDKYKKDVKIKLINDIYYDDKKVVGILCKHIISKSAVIIGIGIDIYNNDDVPDDIKDIVGHLFDEKIDEDILIKDIVDNIYNIFAK